LIPAVCRLWFARPWQQSKTPASGECGAEGEQEKQGDRGFRHGGGIDAHLAGEAARISRVRSAAGPVLAREIAMKRPIFMD